jgi:hypothetical protein
MIFSDRCWGSSLQQRMLALPTLLALICCIARPQMVAADGWKKPPSPSLTDADPPGFKCIRDLDAGGIDLMVLRVDNKEGCAW